MAKVVHDKETTTEEIQYKLVEEVPPRHEPMAVLRLNGTYITVGS